MDRNELHDFLSDAVEYPIDRATVQRAIGDEIVSAPDDEDSRTVAEILELVDTDAFQSADELFDTILGAVPDEYIGRKFYDDRGTNLDDDRQVRVDRRDQSF